MLNEYLTIECNHVLWILNEMIIAEVKYNENLKLS